MLFRHMPEAKHGVGSVFGSYIVVRLVNRLFGKSTEYAPYGVPGTKDTDMDTDTNVH
jgi:hypothetical protein